MNGFSKISPTDFPVTCTMGYRFSFNGMEKDDEVKGVGNSLDFGARIYDSRLGRWLSIDPLAKKYTSLSPYNFVANNPLNNVDLDGRDIKPLTSTDVNTLTNVFNSFKGLFNATSYNSKIDVGNASGDSKGSSNVFTTNTSAKVFETRLANSKLSESEKNEARAVFKVLSSNDIVEIGVVTANTNASSTGLFSSSEIEIRGTTNPDALKLFENSNKSTEVIQQNLMLQSNSGNTNNDPKDKGSFGFYPQIENCQTSTNGIFVGLILVNPNTNDNSMIGPPTQPDENKSVIKAIEKANLPLTPRN